MKRIELLFVALVLFLTSVSISYASSYQVTTDLTIRAVINTVEKGAVDAVWKYGGEDTTSRGDSVVWGFFYADPNDVSWGSQNNPEVFVKIWYDAGGRVDVNFFHVSVPDIEVSAIYNGVDLKATATTTKRYIRHYYNDNNSDGTSENTEDGIPVSGLTQRNKPLSYSTINNLNIGATINTVEALGSIDAVWILGGTDTTSRGDQVVWGYFYADPNDVTWGSKNNPELFVKIWFDASGRIDVNFFHVSVPDIEVYSDYGSDGIYDNKGTTIMDDRYIRHEYNKIQLCEVWCSTNLGPLWGLTCEEGPNTKTESCKRTNYVVSYKDNCTGTITYQNSGNSYNYTKIYQPGNVNWQLSIDVEGIGSCTQ